MTSLGHTFLQARTDLGISVRDASFQTRLPEQAILDLEQDRYLEFDSLVYLRWFIQRYSEFLGLNCSECLERMQVVIEQGKAGAEYLSTGHRTLPGTQKPIRKQAPGGGMPVFLAPVLLLLLAFVGISLYALAQRNLPGVQTAAPGPEATAAPPAQSQEIAAHPDDVVAPGIPTASDSRRMRRRMIEARLIHSPTSAETAVPENGPPPASENPSEEPLSP
jgi:cytoskeletal protein RodZ